MTSTHLCLDYLWVPLVPEFLYGVLRRIMVPRPSQERPHMFRPPLSRPPSLLLRLSLTVVLCFGTSACAGLGEALVVMGGGEATTSNSGNRIVTESRIDGDQRLTETGLSIGTPQLPNRRWESSPGSAGDNRDDGPTWLFPSPSSSATVGTVNLSPPRMVNYRFALNSAVEMSRNSQRNNVLGRRIPPPSWSS